MKKTFEDVRPDLAKYYRPELNDEQLMNEHTIFSQRIVMCCDVCGEIQNRIISQYTRKNRSEFLCGHCNSLGVNFPELLKEWHPTKNGDIDPFKISKYTHTRIWWKCAKGHEWHVQCMQRSKSGNGCPYCGKHYLSETNSLIVNYPQIVEEWHHEKNGEYKDVPFGTKTKFWWKCSEGHEWRTMVLARTKDFNGCPYCKSSKGEKIITDWLKKMSIDFVTQYSVNINGSNRRFDIYVPDFKLFIEVNGAQHYKDINYFTMNLKQQQITDRQKKEYAEANGHYLCIDYREHNPVLALERFEKQFDDFLDKVIDGTIVVA